MKKLLMILCMLLPTVAHAQEEKNIEIIAMCGELNGETYTSQEHKWIEDGFAEGQVAVVFDRPNDRFDIAFYNKYRDGWVSVIADGGSVRIHRNTPDDLVVIVEYYHSIAVYTFYRKRNFYTYLESKNYINTARTTRFQGTCEFIWGAG